jgi:integrase
MARRPARRIRGALRVYDRAGIWWAQVPGAGRRSLALRVSDTPRDEAYRAAAQRYGAGDLDARAAAAALTDDLADLVPAYIEAMRSRWAPRHKDNAVTRLSAFVEVLDGYGVRTAPQVTPAILTRYVEARQAEGVTNATINRTIQLARAMARYATGRTPPLCSPTGMTAWKNLPELARNKDPLIPSPIEWAAVIRACEADHDGRPRSVANARGMALLTAVAVQTGLRIDELRHLRAVDISDDAVHVRAYDDWRPKNREDRTVPVPTAVATLAREMVGWRTKAKGLNGKPLALGDHWVLDRLAAAWETARLPGPPPGAHDARRTFATELSRTAGVSVRDVQRLLGHADLETTQRYLGRYRTDAARTAVDMGVSAVLSGPPARVVPLRRRTVR